MDYHIVKTLEFNVPVAMLIVVIIYIHFIEIKKKKMLKITKQQNSLNIYRVRIRACLYLRVSLIMKV